MPAKFIIIQKLKLQLSLVREKKERSDSVLLQKPLHRQKNPKSNVKHKNATKNFDYTTIADRLRTVS